jgi:cobalt-zinc-cadmium efflux system protein
MGAHHHHDHPHDHGPGHVHVHVPAGRDPRPALAVALGLNGAFLLIEAGVGAWTGSLALLSDAAHMLSDVAALALALGAAQLARRRASATMTFGLGRAEVLGAWTNGLLLLLACGWIAFEGVERLILGPPPVPGFPVLVVGAIGLAINLGSAFFLWRSDPENLNVRAALAHMLADALGSVGAVLAAVLVMAGLPAADPAISLLIAAMVTWGAVRVLRESGRVLLELPPARVEVPAIRDALLGLDGVEAVHDLHVWSLDGSAPLVSTHLVADPRAVGIAARARRVLAERFGVTHLTVQVEDSEEACPQADCGEGAVATGQARSGGARTRVVRP